MTLAFFLSMPGCASWNGRWSGEGKCYAIVRNFSGIKETAKAREIHATHYFSYGWSDGWRAAIEVKEVSCSEARGIRAKSQGFCGYDWMVDSIVARGKILADHEIEKTAAVPSPTPATVTPGNDDTHGF